ncbi:integrase core domain-containing protein [Methylorubrum suomiense]
MPERASVPEPAGGRTIIEAWRVDYNTCRPHTSLGGLTPNAFATRSRQDQNQNGLWL